MSFCKSLGVGRQAEKRVCDTLSRGAIPSLLNEAKDVGTLACWDVEAGLGGPIKIEVKHDKMASLTGNVAVEYHNPKKDKPSGLMATQADLWAVVLGSGEVWVSLTTNLKKFFAEAECVKDVALGGDSNAAMRLYKKDEILGACFTRIDEVDPWEIGPILESMLATGVSVS